MKNHMRNEMSRQSFRPGWFAATFIIMAGLTLAGCSGGGSSSGADVSTPDYITSSVEGTFVDSPVQGLNYTTPSGVGLTDENGQFVCPAGEMIQFMIGDVMLGEVQAKDVVTPMDFVDPSDLSMGFNNPMLVNMGRFLQSLDADGNPENGITITQEVRDQVSGRMIDFHQSIHDFENDPDVMAMFATMNGLNMPHNGMDWELVDGEGAQQHMINYMGPYMTDAMKAIMNEHMGSGTQTSGGVGDSPINNGNMMSGQGGNNQNTPMGGAINNNMGSGMQSGGDVNNLPMNSGTMMGSQGGNGGMKGTFVDSQVQGLTYTTYSGSGVTDENGQFFCNPGEMIQFMIGDVLLGEIQAKDVITPMDFVDPAEWSMGFNHPMLVNMGRFLQSLDADANPENGITITEDVRNQMHGLMIDFHQSIQDFENDPNMMTLFDTLNGLNMPHNGFMWELVDIEDAQQHMIEHMSKFMDEDMLAIMNEHMGQGTPGADGIDMPGSQMMDEEMIDYMNEHMGVNQEGVGGNFEPPMGAGMGGRMGR
ncbi:MAG: hypothetical protein C4518_05145 [Desulfobacteraceae bacterium]|nr:MAG: hypothetical protein C4518_05145 [Desulfobacteraceae bacterium]